LYVLDGGILTPDNDLTLLVGNAPDIRSLAYAPDGRLAAASGSGLFLREQNQWRRLYPKAGTYSWAAEDARAVLFDSNGSLWFTSPQGVGRMSTDNLWSLATGLEGLPWNGFTKAIASNGNSIWFGTDLGTIRVDSQQNSPSPNHAGTTAKDAAGSPMTTSAISLSTIVATPGAPPPRRRPYRSKNLHPR
jgi:ligand-binding sensor domain-containing protein